MIRGNKTTQALKSLHKSHFRSMWHLQCLLLAWERIISQSKWSLSVWLLFKNILINCQTPDSTRIWRALYCSVEVNSHSRLQLSPAAGDRGALINPNSLLRPERSIYISKCSAETFRFLNALFMLLWGVLAVHNALHEVRHCSIHVYWWHIFMALNCAIMAQKCILFTNLTTVIKNTLWKTKKPGF